MTNHLNKFEISCVKRLEVIQSGNSTKNGALTDRQKKDKGKKYMTIDIRQKTKDKRQKTKDKKQQKKTRK